MSHFISVPISLQFQLLLVSIITVSKCTSKNPQNENSKNATKISAAEWRAHAVEKDSDRHLVQSFNYDYVRGSKKRRFGQNDDFSDIENDSSDNAKSPLRHSDNDSNEGLIDLDDDIALGKLADEVYADEFVEEKPNLRVQYGFVKKQYAQCVEDRKMLDYCIRALRNVLKMICYDHRCPQALPLKMNVYSKNDCTKEFLKRRGVNWDPPNY